MKKNIKKIKRMIALLLCAAISMSMTCGTVFAKELPPDIRVNGYLVTFPDAQPYIDENDRTMIPVRFVTEAMGADVSWVQETQTAVIEKAGIKVEVTIGQQDIRVTKDGATETVAMDTMAVINESRTYVPIRFVAEALGAYVDYADAYHVVGIYNDVFTAEEIRALRSYPYTDTEHSTPYEEFKAENTPEKTVDRYGEKRETFENFANAHEFLYRSENRSLWHTYTYKNVEPLYSQTYTLEEFNEHLVDEVIAELTYSSANITVTVRADTSCLYQPNEASRFANTLRIIATVSRSADSDWLTVEEAFRAGDLGISKLPKGSSVSSYVDVHLQTLGGVKVAIIEFDPLEVLQ